MNLFLISENSEKFTLLTGGDDDGFNPFYGGDLFYFAPVFQPVANRVRTQQACEPSLRSCHAINLSKSLSFRAKSRTADNEAALSHAGRRRRSESRRIEMGQ